MINRKLTKKVILLTSLTLLLCALTVGGVFAYRVLHHADRLRYYDADGELLFTEQYDSKGRLAGYTGYRLGEKSYLEEYRVTDECAKADDSEIRRMDGVRQTETREVFCRNASADEMKSDDTLLVSGYDRFGRLVAMQVFSRNGDAYVLLYTNRYERDSFGNFVSMSRVTPDGETVAEMTFENTYRFGRLIRSEKTYQVYGRAYANNDGSVTLKLFQEPRTGEQTIRYQY